MGTRQVRGKLVLHDVKRFGSHPARGLVLRGFDALGSSSRSA